MMLLYFWVACVNHPNSIRKMREIINVTSKLPLQHKNQYSFPEHGHQVRQYKENIALKISCTNINT